MINDRSDLDKLVLGRDDEGRAWRIRHTNHGYLWDGDMFIYVHDYFGPKR